MPTIPETENAARVLKPDGAISLFRCQTEIYDEALHT